MAGPDRILVVDDDPGACRLLSLSLAPLGYEIVSASNGLEALKRLDEEQFSTVVLDLTLPDIGGIEILEHIREQKIKTEVVVVTAYASLKTAVEALRLGAYDYSTKPFKVENIQSVVRRAVQKHHLETRLAAIYDLSRDMALLPDADRVAETVLDIAARALVFDLCDVWLVDKTRVELHLLATAHKDHEAALRLPLDGEKSIVAACARSGEPIYVPDAREDPRYIAAGSGNRSELAVPLKVRGRVIGVLNIEAAEVDVFGEGDLQLLSALAAQAAVAIENVRLREAIQQELTERERAEEETRILAELVDASPASITVHDCDGSFIYANRKTLDLHGYTHDEFFALNLHQLDVPDSERLIAPRTQELGERGETSFEVAHYRKDGTTIPLYVNAKAARWGSREVVLSIATDITKRKRTEEALRDSEERYRQLFESESDALFLIDNKTGRILEANSAASDLYGYSREELLAKKNTDLSAEPEDTRRVTRTTPLTPDQVVTIPLRFHRKRDGTVFLAEITGRFFIRQGRPVHIAAIRDITERKRAEEALRRSEATLRSIFRAAPVGIGLVSNRVLLQVNDRICEMTGYFRDELVGQSARALYLPRRHIVQRRCDNDELVGQSARALYPTDEDYEYVGQEKYAQIHERGTGSVETRWQCKDGRIIDVLLSSTPLDPSDLSAGVTFTALDITERKRAEGALQESERKYRFITEKMTDTVWLMDMQLEPTFISPSVTRTLGYTLEELQALSLDELLTLESFEFAMKTVDTELSPERLAPRPYERSVTVELEFRRKDGSPLWSETTVTLLRDSEGHPTGLMGVGRDITERKRAEEALRESEERFRALVETSSDWIWEANEHGVYTYSSPKAKDLLGYEPAEIVGRTPFDLMLPEEAGRLREQMAEINQARRPFARLENANRHKDGHVVVLETSGVPIFDPNGVFRGYRGIDRDITERKRLEGILEKERQELRLIIDSSPIIVFYKDKEGRFIRVNRTFAEALEMPEGSFVGKTVFDLYSSGIAQGMTDDDQGVLQSGCSKLNITEQYESASGLRWVQTDKIPICDKNGIPVGLIGFAQDITERKQAEAERERLLAQVQEQAQRVQQIMDMVPEGVIVLDADNRVILVNPLGEKDLATLAGAQVGDTLLRLGDRPLAKLLTSPPKGLWHEVVTDSRSFQAIARPIEDGPTPKGWVLVIRDVTQQREIERRIQQQERLAALGQLAAGIAHDFNNIMAVITLYAGMSLRIPDLPSIVYERLEIINQQARRASDLIQQVLDFSRRAVLERGPMDLLTFLKEQVKLLERTLPENIGVDLFYGKDEYTVNADPTRMQQAVMNLATNARDAMPGGGRLSFGLERIHVRDRAGAPLPDMEAGDWVCVTVTDTGSGIPPDVLPHIYDPFFTTKAPGLGTGLGLSQVYGIVKQHEGHIDVRSKVEEGTIFTFYLPALPVQPPETTGPKLEHLVQGQGQTILVVEDEVATRKAVVSSLEVLGYQVLEAANGREALATIERHADEISLVLSDIVMPEMGGQALFHALKQRNLAVKVVLLTGHPLEEKDLENLRTQGLQDWLLKPPSLEQLADVVARALGNQAPREG